MYGGLSTGDSPINSQYEEIVAHVKCPTCRGSGKIPRDSREEYIALIPWSDKRLQPPRTMLKVCASVFLCMLLCGLLLFFLLPRTIRLSSEGLLIKPYFSRVVSEYNLVEIYMKVPFNLTNSNYVPIYLSKISTQVRIGQTILAEQENDTVNEYIPMRRTDEIGAYVNISRHGDDFRGLVFECENEWSYFHNVDMEFTITVEASMLGHSVEATLSTRQYVNCYPTIRSTTAAPTTTTHQSST
jgi:hypothetical protein